jgi:thymidylate synthase (FAD)
MKIKCLDKGYVELMNHTPQGDLLVVNAARCSFDKEHVIFDEERDTDLISYLAKHDHLLPFRHPSVTLRIHAPLFVIRQLGKHQVGFSWSEISRRYIKTRPEFYYPELNEWRESAENVKQGSSSNALPEYIQHNTQEGIEQTYALALHYYHDMLEDGICAEQARMILPQSMYTTTVTTGTLLGWFHMFKLRSEAHTQKESRVYAEAIDEIIGNLFSESWSALCEHCL